jgi:hypothetical protein
MSRFYELKSFFQIGLVVHFKVTLVSSINTTRLIAIEMSPHLTKQAQGGENDQKRARI